MQQFWRDESVHARQRLAQRGGGVQKIQVYYDSLSYLDCCLSVYQILIAYLNLTTDTVALPL